MAVSSTDVGEKVSLKILLQYDYKLVVSLKQISSNQPASPRLGAAFDAKDLLCKARDVKDGFFHADDQAQSLLLMRDFPYQPYYPIQKRLVLALLETLNKPQLPCFAPFYDAYHYLLFYYVRHQRPSNPAQLHQDGRYISLASFYADPKAYVQTPCWNIGDTYTVLLANSPTGTGKTASMVHSVFVYHKLHRHDVVVYLNALHFLCNYFIAHLKPQQAATIKAATIKDPSDTNSSDSEWEFAGKMAPEDMLGKTALSEKGLGWTDTFSLETPHRSVHDIEQIKTQVEQMAEAISAQTRRDQQLIERRKAYLQKRALYLRLTSDATDSAPDIYEKVRERIKATSFLTFCKIDASLLPQRNPAAFSMKVPALVSDNGRDSDIDDHESALQKAELATLIDYLFEINE